MRRIEAGTFLMGSNESAESVAAAFPGESADDFHNEHPLRNVRIRASFYMSTTEVTYAQFKAFVDATGYRTTFEQGRFGGAATSVKVNDNATSRMPETGRVPARNHPVSMVSYHDAVAFCQWLSRQEGKYYRLPTDAEWEYAARAGTRIRYWNGNDPRMLTRVANISDGTLRRNST